MTRLGIGLGMLLVFVVQVPAGEQPKGPPPIIKKAQIDNAGRAYLVDVVYQAIVTIVPKKILVDGKEVSRNEEIVKMEPLEIKVYLDAPGIEVYGVDGKRVNLKSVRLPGPTPVLVSADGKVVDPVYLQLVREGTLVVVARSVSPPKEMPKEEPKKKIPREDKE